MMESLTDMILTSEIQKFKKLAIYQNEINYTEKKKSPEKEMVNLVKKVKGADSP